MRKKIENCKVVEVMPKEVGQGKNGEWQKIVMVVEVEESDNWGETSFSNVAVTAFGRMVDKIQELMITKGDLITVGVDFSSRKVTPNDPMKRAYWDLSCSLLFVNKAETKAKSTAPIAQPQDNTPYGTTFVDDDMPIYNE